MPTDGSELSLKAAKVAIELAQSLHAKIIYAIISYGCDLVIMASHGRKLIERWFLGSETQQVIAKSTVPVMVIH